MKKLLLTLLVLISSETFAKEVCNVATWDNPIVNCSLPSDAVDLQGKTGVAIVKELMDKGYVIATGDLYYGLILVKP